VAEEAVVHPGGGGGVRLADGGRFGPLRGAPRRKATGGGLLRGDALPACRPGARTLPGQSGMSATRYYDYEYERRGVANVFAFFEPKGCWRHMEEVTERRTGRDFAFLRCAGWWTSTIPGGRKGARGARDNLNTHTRTAL
jgi:hypothetical protein